jgi:hypothetical protein
MSFTSCTKEIDIDTAGFERKIVVNSLFTPDKPFEFHFSYTIQPNESFPIFTDSIHLWLYENGNEILDEKFLSDTLISSYYPKKGCEYSLKVYIQGYDTVFACDTVPSQVNIADGSLQLISIDKYQTSTCSTIISFSDPAHETNYYEIFFKDAQYDYENKTTDLVLINEGDVSFYPETYFFSDELFNGKTYLLQINRHLYFNTTEKVILRNISYEYYMYRKYWTRHSYNQIMLDKGIGALIYSGEPQPMYNNIVNGYGVFAAYIENAPFTLRKIEH